MIAQQRMAGRNVELLHQGAELLGRIDDRQYAEAPPDRPGAAVGGHLRHCLDFYRCFLTGLEGGHIDYDGRERDPCLETERERALALLREIAEALEALDADPDLPLAVRQDEEEGAEGRWGASSLHRELQFLLSHTVHHYALIALLLRGHGVEPPAGFGFAPSTLRHLRQR
jgi:uncharacterized damage-inducible protein DinB